MKRFIMIIIALALLCTACGAQNTASNTAASQSVVSPTAYVSVTPLPTEQADVLTDPADSSKEITGDFSVVSEAGAIVPDGTVYTITEAGDYTVTGALAEGRIVIDAGDDDEIKLILSNASISCSTDAPIAVLNAASLTVKADADSYNTVSDLRSGNADAASHSEENRDAAIYATCDLTLSGSGTLIVIAEYDNGVKSKDDLKVKNLTLKVTAVGNALKGNDSVEIKSGDLILISTASDGIKTENSTLSSKGKQKGSVTISGGHVDVYAACDGISAAYNAEISGRDGCIVNIRTASYADSFASAAQQEQYLVVPISLYSENSAYYAFFYNDDDTSGVWVECTYDTMVYSGRTASYYGLVFRVPDGYRNLLFQVVDKGTTPDGENYTASGTGDTVNTAMNGYLISSVSGSVIYGDWIRLGNSAGSSNKTTYSSKGVKAENEILIGAGTVTIAAMDDGLHANSGSALENGATGAGNITIDGGTLTITCADDGIHADSMLTVNAGTVCVSESHEGLEANVVTLNGGTVTVNANDDGLNACAGSTTPMIVINGGYLDVATPSGDTDAIDSNGSFLMTGGTVLVRGGSSMGGMSGSVDVDGSVTVTGGTIVALGGVCQIPRDGSVNTYVSSGTTFPAGEYRLVDSDGSVIFSFTLSSSYTSCWIASDVFTLNGSYALEKDGTALLTWTQTSATEGSYQQFGNYGGFGGHGRR